MSDAAELQAHSSSIVEESNQVFSTGLTCIRVKRAGRPVLELMDKLITRAHHPTPFKRLSDNVCVCSNPELSFEEYTVALPKYCEILHSVSSCCKDCKALLAIACSALENGFVRLCDIFRSAFPGVTYHAHSAISRIFSATSGLRVGCPKSGTSEVYIVEYIPEVNYNHLMSLVNTLLQQKPSVPVFSKDELKGLLKIARSDREKEWHQICNLEGIRTLCICCTETIWIR